MAGRNKGNLLGLDSEEGIVEEVDMFRGVLGGAVPVVDISMGDNYSIVLTKAGQVWIVGGDTREVVRVEVDSEVLKHGSLCFVAACHSLAVVVTQDGTVFSLKKEDGSASKVISEGAKGGLRTPVKMIKSQDSFVILYKLN